MQLHLENGTVIVSGIPDGTVRLRSLVNGLPSLAVAHEVGAAANAVLPLAAVVEALEDPGTLAESTRLTVLAYDGGRAELARASLPDCPVPCRRHEDTLVPGTGSRVVASALQGPGDAHTWHLRLPCWTAAAPAAVYLRATFEDHPLVRQPGVATVVWATTASVAPPPTDPVGAGRAVKRPRLVPPAAWGERRATTVIGGDCRDSCYLGPLVGEDDAATSAVVRCTLTWLAATPGPGGLLRYAVHATVVPELGLPPQLFVTVPAADPDAEGAAALGSPPTSPTSPSLAQIGRKRAVIVGVSKYRRRPRGADLEWCDPGAARLGLGGGGG